MLVIGLTGGLGSGKSTVAGMFAKLGADVLDADKISHGLLKKGRVSYKKIIRAFGKEVLTGGKIDRRKLAKIVFADKRKLRILEKIIHPQVRKEMEQKLGRLKRSRRKAVVLDIPLLFESGLKWPVDVTVVVKAKKELQIKRAVKNLNITKLEAQKRIKNQMPLKNKIRLADLTIDNNGSKIKTNEQVKKVWERLLLKK
jgi:dephospho-CoA kinase